MIFSSPDVDPSRAAAFTETKKVGFGILECDSLEEAVDIASKHPMARAGRLDVRAFWPFGG